MAKVKWEERIECKSGNIYLIYQVDDEDGYEVEMLGEQGKGGNMVGVCTFTFGHGEDNSKLANAFMGYAVSFLRTGDSAKIEERMRELDGLTEKQVLDKAVSNINT